MAEGPVASSVGAAKADLWYGMCGYWTTDWSKLITSSKSHGIPLCPGCGAPGFIKPVAEWWEEVDRYEAEGHPGYRAGVEANEGVCPRRQPRTKGVPELLADSEKSGFAAALDEVEAKLRKAEEDSRG